ncbi:DddA-like double-stranded DNA deaminase toxin [Actinosynnema sp. NPDC059335]|uniref:DddA-like double-stranded DNA deaminase toxin n=1 Tax=Actinosynnema sp. NPDC059335 TaxID=3346804 RepID=UPI00366E7FA7
MIDGVTAAGRKAFEAKTALEQAEDLAEDAQALLAIALEGDTTGDKDAVLGRIAETVKGIKELWKTLVDGITRTEAVLSAVRGTATPPPTSPSSPPAAQPAPTTPAGQPQTTAVPPVVEPPPLLPEQVEELRRDLPPTVIGGTGQKTHGRWIAPDGSTQRAVSGRDEWTPKINAALAAEGCPRLPVITEADVELKLAARMREQGAADLAMRHLTLVLNSAPCEGPFGCDSLLPAMLPKGYTLAVHGPDGYYKKFTGGKPPWRR